MPLQATSGAASYDAFGGGVPVVPVYIEDVMSTWLYTGTGASQTITNGIDLSGKGGLTWIKARTQPSFASNNTLFDTIRGTGKQIYSDLTSAQATDNTSLTAFNATGFTLGTDSTGTVNYSGHTFASWTFRKQPKFFDVVTYTGNGTAGRTVAHNLGSVPGCIIVKQTSASGQGWPVYHRSEGNGRALLLNDTAASFLASGYWNTTTPTSTEFTLGSSAAVNESGQTYVAYLFAHNAGGFGLAGTDNVISCGSFSGASLVTLGYEPQWVLIRRIDTAADWRIFDTMRGFNVSAGGAQLEPNTSNAESIGYNISPSATGFTPTDFPSGTYIYIAIRRGPMKVPTSGTSVFSPVNQTGGGTVTTNFPVDLLISTTPSQSSYRIVNDRLRGASTTRDVPLYTNTTDAETVGTGYGFGFDNNTGYIDGLFTSSFSDLYLNFRRAPSFFDEVCWTGDGTSNRVIPHNLTVVPELSITKSRNATGIGDVDSKNWIVRCSAGPSNYLGMLNTSDSGFPWGQNTYWPTTSVWFGTGSSLNTGTLSNGNDWANGLNEKFVTYLFATCAGVSKVGSYTGNGSSQTINCGFTGGSRFVLIKKT